MRYATSALVVVALLGCSMAWSAVLNVPSVEYATIQSAVTAAQTGDTVSVSGGPYTEDVWINNVSQNRDGITISGPGVTLNGGFFIEQPNGAGSDDVTIDGFTIEGGGFTGSIRNGIRVHASNARILNCTIGGVTGSQSRAIETSRPSDGLLIEGCRILASNLNGLYLNAADRVVCRGNYFEKGIGSDGLTNFLAEYNVFSGSSFGCGPGGSSIQLHYNDFINNSGRAVTWYKEGSATGDFDAENNWWGSVNGPSDALGTTETDGSSDPGVATGLNIDPAGALGAVVSDALANWSTQAGTNHIDYIPWSTGPNNISLVVDDVTCGKNQTAELKATLTNNGVGVVGKLITFSVDGSAAGTGTTDGNGVATADYVVTQGLGAYVIQARFAGDASTLPATGYGTLSVPVPNVVWVDDDFTATGANGGHVWGYDAFATIQGGVNAVAEGGTVNVAVGTYSESVTVAKSLTLNGAQAGVTPVAGGRAGGESSITETAVSSSSGITITGDDVIVDGFEIADRYDGISCKIARALHQNVVIRNNYVHSTKAWTGMSLMTNGGVTSTFRNYSITSNYFDMLGAAAGKSYVLAAIAVSSGSNPPYLYDGLAIEDNVINNSSMYGVFAGGTVANFEVHDAQITGNSFACARGLNIAKLSNPTISDNTFACSGTGMSIGADGGSISDNVLTFTGDPGTDAFGIDIYGGQYGSYIGGGLQVTGNDVTGAAGCAWTGIRVRGGVGPNASIHGNTITDCDTGIWVRASGGITTWLGNDIQGNDILGTGTAGLRMTGVSGATDLAIGSTEFSDGMAQFILLESCPVNIDAMAATFGSTTSGPEIEARVQHKYDIPPLGLVSYPDSRTAAQIAVSDATGQPGETVQLAAQLTASGTPIGGVELAFWVDDAQVGTATTDSLGNARFSYTIDAGAANGAHVLYALYAGDTTYRPAVGEGTLNVNAVPTSIVLTLSDYDILAGETTTATVVDQSGQDLTALCSLTIEGGAGGSWSGDEYTSEFAGTWPVTAIYGGLTDSVDLTVLHGAATDLDIAPDAATIGAGESQTYSVVATDAFGNTWTPDAGDLNWDAGVGAGTFTDYTYTSVAGDAGKTLDIQATLGTLPSDPSDVAKLTVNPLDGAGLILAWDKDTRGFYLCANPANPAGSVANPAVAVNASGIYDIDGDLVGDVTVVVSGTATNRTVSVTIAGVTNKLQVRYYLRSGALLYVYMYSTIGTTLKTAVYQGPLYGDQTFVDGAYKPGFWGLTHTLDAGDPATITYGAALQP